MEPVLPFARANTSPPDARDRRLVVLFPINHFRLLIGIFGVHMLLLACEIGNAHFGLWHKVSHATAKRLRKDVYLDLIVRFWILALVYGGGYALLASWTARSWMLFQSLWSWAIVSLLHGAFQMHMFVWDQDDFWDWLYLVFPFVTDFWNGAFVYFAYRVCLAHEKTLESVVYDSETIELLPSVHTPPVASLDLPAPASSIQTTTTTASTRSISKSLNNCRCNHGTFESTEHAIV